MPALKLAGAVDLAALHRQSPERFPALLQTLGRPGWDILFAFPREILSGSTPPEASFFATLDETWQAGRRPPEAGLPDLPFRGGWFAYLGYELLQGIEPSVPVRDTAGGAPLYWLARVPAAVLVTPDKSATWIVAEPEEAGLLETVRSAIDRLATPVLGVAPQVEGPLVEEAPDRFLAGVERIQHYIREGDVFQVNLSRRWRLPGPTRGSAADLYAGLCRANPAPFAGLLDMGNYAIVSSSPERLVQVRGGWAETWPIAGTHPRSPDPIEDARLRDALIAHPKERAEHVMLVDLERNDLGRVCESGSVRVEELAQVYSYAYVHHIESRVRGRVRAEVTPGILLAALFPGGTITGCPKVRTMQIIRELEATPRRAYTGSLGYINHDGSLDFNILIRSLILSRQGIEFSTGAGIVADSVPERELNETRAKAKGLLRGLGLA